MKATKQKLIRFATIEMLKDMRVNNFKPNSKNEFEMRLNQLFSGLGNHIYNDKLETLNWGLFVNAVAKEVVKNY